MDPKQEENQNEQSSKEGPLSQGLDAFNNLKGLRGLSGKTGSRTTVQAGRLAAQGAVRAGVFLVSNPVGWIILAILLIVIPTIIIVVSLGAPQGETNTIQAANPTTMPTPAL